MQAGKVVNRRCLERRSMITRLVLLGFLLITAGAASAQSDAVPAVASPAPVASPVPPATPAGFSGRAHLTITFPTRSMTITATARVAIASRDLLTRLDVLSILTSIAPMQLGPMTVVIDRGSNMMTLWNGTSHTYYTQTFLPSMFGGAPRPTPSAVRKRPAKPARSMLADLDLLTFDMRLTGHTVTAGLPTTGLAMEIKARQHRQTAVTHVTGAIQLADDYAFFPASLLIRAQTNPTIAPAVIAYAVDAFARDQPAADAFTIPDGYTQAPSPLAVIMGLPPGRRAPAATATPSASPTP